MHELMMNCLYLLATILSILGTTAGILIVKGIIDAINHHEGHHEG